MLTTLLTVALLGGGPNIINEDAKLVPNDASQFGGFGARVVIDGDTAVITSSGSDIYGLDAGAAWVFQRNAAGEFEQTQLLAGDDVSFLDEFGYAISLHDGLLVIGARYHIVDGLVSAGAAYIFEQGGDGLFIQTQKLISPTPMLDEAYAWSLDTDGDRIVIGSRGGNAGAGAAYVYENSGGVWTHSQTLAGTDIDANDQFGRTVSIQGDRVAVGAPYFAAGCGGSNRCGSVFMFDDDGTSWNQTHRLTPSDQANEDYFGWSVALGNDRLLATSVYDDDMGTQSGSGYVFDLANGNWSQSSKLIAPDGQPQDFMGMCGLMDGDRIVLGGWYGNDGKGAAWMWQFNGTHWAFDAEAQASDGAGYDIFGRSVALDGDTLMVGADWADIDGIADAGAVYVYDLGDSGVEGACCTNAMCVASTESLCDYFGGAYRGDGTDCADADCTSCMGDVNHDGAVTVDDLLIVISQFGPCP